MPVNNSLSIILFARDPELGRVKTRLNSTFDFNTVCELYKCFLSDSFELLGQIDHVDRFCGVASSGQLSDYFEQPAIDYKLTVFPQSGRDLGERMKQAFADRFDEGYEKVVLIGSDSPSLPTAYIDKAFGSEKDVMLGPSQDGGYYLIGMNRKVCNIFDEVDWGTSRVLDQTLERIKREGVSLELLPVWYDVDELEDLRFLKTHLELQETCGQNTSMHTLNFVRQMSL